MTHTTSSCFLDENHSEEGENKLGGVIPSGQDCSLMEQCCGRNFIAFSACVESGVGF